MNISNIVPGAPPPAAPLPGHHHHHHLVFPDLHHPPPLPNPLPFGGSSFDPLHQPQVPHLHNDNIGHPSNPKPPASSNTHPAALSRKKRNLPGAPDPDAEVISLSPKTLMTTNRFVCEICNKGFQRDQNLQLHRRGHNLPWKLKQRSTQNKDGQPVKKKVYVCPEKSCVHHEPSRALGDLTGIKKHFSRKHGEKKWKCEKCSKKYAVQSDWKAHSKTCGTREYKCDCGTLFSRKDSFITHRAFCDALSEESARQVLTAAPVGGRLSFKGYPDPIRINTASGGEPAAAFAPQGFVAAGGVMGGGHGMSSDPPFGQVFRSDYSGIGLSDHQMIMQMASMPNFNVGMNNQYLPIKQLEEVLEASSSASKTNLIDSLGSFYSYNIDHHHHGHLNNQYCNPLQIISSDPPAAPMSATALLHKAAQLGSTSWSNSFGINYCNSFGNVVMMSSSSPSNIHPRNSFGNAEACAAVPPPANSSGQVNINIGAGGSASSVVATTLSAPAPYLMNDDINNDHGAASHHDQSKAQRRQAASCKLILDQRTGLTRDFLGMGGGDDNIGGRTFLPIELANFASMTSSTMDLSQFSSGN